MRSNGTDIQANKLALLQTSILSKDACQSFPKCPDIRQSSKRGLLPPRPGFSLLSLLCIRCFLASAAGAEGAGSTLCFLQSRHPCKPQSQGHCLLLPLLQPSRPKLKRVEALFLPGIITTLYEPRRRHSPGAHGCPWALPPARTQRTRGAQALPRGLLESSRAQAHGPLGTTVWTQFTKNTT